MVHLLLLGAILAEVSGTIAMRYSEGFTRLVPSFLAVAGVGLGYYLFALALKLGAHVGVAYAIWAAFGVLLVTLISATVLGDQLTGVQAGGIALVLAGVATLELGSAA